MNAVDKYQAVVIGSGQGGTPLSRALANAGLRTALIERAHVGGTCINEGCTPTKTMVASARVAYLARRAADYGVLAGDVRVDMARVRQRKREIVNSFRQGSQARLEKTPNLELIFGEAAFTAARSLLVRLADHEQREITADRIFINAGARPARPRPRRPDGRALSRQHVRDGARTTFRNTSSSSEAATSGWSSARCSAGSAAA